MDEKKYKLINMIFNSIIYLIFTIWLFLAILNNFFNIKNTKLVSKYKNLETNLFIVGSFFWIVLGIIQLQKECTEYLNN